MEALARVFDGIGGALIFGTLWASGAVAVTNLMHGVMLSAHLRTKRERREIAWQTYYLQHAPLGWLIRRDWGCYVSPDRCTLLTFPVGSPPFKRMGLI